MSKNNRNGSANSKNGSNIPDVDTSRNDRPTRSSNSKPRRSNRGKPANRKPIDTHSIESNGRVMNNPNYYFTDSELATQATSISFNTFLGVPDDYSGEGATGTNMTPTAMKIELMGTAGPINPNYPAAAGINMAGRKLYTRLSSINAKTTNYAPQDLITLMLALGSTLEYISFLRRCFGLAFTTSYRNRFVPKEILKMMGLDADDFFKNIAAYRLQFNTIMNLLMKVPFPANVAYFDKCATLYDHIWTDSEDMNIAQLYVFAPYCVWKFNETYSEQGTGLSTVVVSNNTKVKKHMSEYLSVLSDMVEALVTSATLNFVYADILNLATKENIPLYQIQYLPENYIVLPEYNAEALLQIHNMTIVGTPSHSNSQSIEHFTPDNDVVPNVNKNVVDYYPVFFQTSASLSTRKIIDFPNGQPDVAQIIEATRYAAITGAMKEVTSGSSKTYYMSELAMGDHVVVDTAIYYADGDLTGNSFWSASAISQGVGSVVYSVAAAFSKFDWSPILYGYDDSDKKKFVNVIGDLNYYTTVDREYLRKVDDLAMMALFEMR